LVLGKNKRRSELSQSSSQVTCLPCLLGKAPTGTLQCSVCEKLLHETAPWQRGPKWLLGPDPNIWVRDPKIWVPGLKIWVCTHIFGSSFGSAPKRMGPHLGPDPNVWVLIWARTQPHGFPLGPGPKRLGPDLGPGPNGWVHSWGRTEGLLSWLPSTPLICVPSRYSA